jgi:low affinity Fe/Cu permease
LGKIHCVKATQASTATIIHIHSGMISAPCGRLHHTAFPELPMTVKDPKSISTSAGWFTRLANLAAFYVGSPGMFLFALATIAVWLVTGPFFHFSNTWQLLVNSWTNIATFLVVFIIQNTQNRDSKAINLKLDELIRSTDKAHNELIDVERLADQELERLADRYQLIRDEWEQRRKKIS